MRRYLFDVCLQKLNRVRGFEVLAEDDEDAWKVIETHGEKLRELHGPIGIVLLHADELGPVDKSEHPHGLWLRSNAQKLARMLDHALPKGLGFALMIVDFEKAGHLGYISTGDRKDVIKAVREWLRGAEQDQNELPS